MEGYRLSLKSGRALNATLHRLLRWVNTCSFAHRPGSRRPQHPPADLLQESTDPPSPRKSQAPCFTIWTKVLTCMSGCGSSLISVLCSVLLLSLPLCQFLLGGISAGSHRLIRSPPEWPGLAWLPWPGLTGGLGWPAWLARAGLAAQACWPGLAGLASPSPRNGNAISI